MMGHNAVTTPKHFPKIFNLLMPQKFANMIDRSYSATVKQMMYVHYSSYNQSLTQ